MIHFKAVFYRCFCITLFSSLMGGMWAQDTLFLDLQTAIRMAQEQSPNAKILRYEYLASKWDLAAFQASLKPQISLNADLPGFSRSINNISQDDGSSLFRTQSLAFSSGSIFVRQELPITGGSIFMSSGVSSLWNFEPLENQLWQTSLLVVGLNQPLFQLNETQWNLREERMEFRRAQINYIASLEEVAQELTRIFFDALVAQKTKEGAQVNLINNDTVFTLSKGRFEVGKIAENELLQSELRYISAQADLEQAELDYQQAIRELRILLNLPVGQPVALGIPQGLPGTQINADFAIAQANQFSLFSQNIGLRRFRGERQLREVQQSNRLRADLQATFGLNQSADDFFDSYQDPVDRQTFSVGINIPLFNWGRGRANREAALARQESLRISLDQEQRDFENDIFFQVRSVQQLEKRLQIAARGDTVAQRRYEISKQRYLIGKISIQDLFIAQQEKDGAQQNYIFSLRSFWNAWAELRRLTLYDFEKQVSLTDEIIE
ncbi:MAG: TolC family protein [Bacteroidota bacterium]